MTPVERSEKAMSSKENSLIQNPKLESTPI